MILLKLIFHSSHEKLQSQVTVTTLKLLGVKNLFASLALSMECYILSPPFSTECGQHQEKALLGCLLRSMGAGKWSSLALFSNGLLAGFQPSSLGALDNFLQNK